MIESNPFQNAGMIPTRDKTFAPFTRQNVSPDAGMSGDDLPASPFQYETGYLCTVEIADELLDKLRKAGEKTETQHQDNVQLTPKAEPRQWPPAAPASIPRASPPESGTPSAKKKNKNDSNDHQMLINRLNKKPHVIEFKGVLLDRNERLKIIAAIALCESDHDPFTAENLDTEFQKMPGANVSYGHIVHIGLSYGLFNLPKIAVH
jgi:hypothetical protein